MEYGEISAKCRLPTLTSDPTPRHDPMIYYSSSRQDYREDAVEGNIEESVEGARFLVHLFSFFL